MKHEILWLSQSEKETMDFGRFLGEHSVDDLFIALTGDLGAGKTHFVQGLAEGLGITGVVSSPTFNIMNYYDGKLPLKHFDFYRLDTEDDLYNIGWDEYSIGGVTVVEWADLFPSLIPSEAIHIQIRVMNETKREIKVSWDDGAPATVVKEIETYASSH